MKNLAKVLSLILAICMVFTLAACGNAETNSEPVDNAKEKLIMATNASFPPYEYKDDNDGFAGIDIEIAGLIADKLGMELEIMDVEFGSIIGGVQSGKYGWDDSY